mmetsp:Transcript_49730/g.131197  ORF Transcript_49730/g.131197 Transcript_49730/m.131197 type:complete len:202 (-) Transcript_49730:2260-2865(-)
MPPHELADRLIARVAEGACGGQEVVALGSALLSGLLPVGTSLWGVHLQRQRHRGLLGGGPTKTTSVPVEKVPPPGRPPHTTPSIGAVLRSETSVDPRAPCRGGPSRVPPPVQVPLHRRALQAYSRLPIKSKPQVTLRIPILHPGALQVRPRRLVKSRSRPGLRVPVLRHVAVQAAGRGLLVKASSWIGLEPATGRTRRTLG